MSSNETRRRVLLGVTGSIAAFKAPSIVRALQHAGFDVRCALTSSAQKIVTEAAFRALLPERPYSEMWSYPGPDGGEVHIQWAEWAEAILIAPASASTIADLRAGRYDSSVTLLAANLPPTRWFIAPAMSAAMWNQPAVAENVDVLRRWGATFLGPEEGSVASGALGQRLSEPSALAKALLAHLSKTSS